MMECEDLQGELLRAQKRFEDAAVHEQESITTMAMLESKVVAQKDAYSHFPSNQDK